MADQSVGLHTHSPHTDTTRWLLLLHFLRGAGGQNHNIKTEQGNSMERVQARRNSNAGRMVMIGQFLCKPGATRENRRP